MADLNGKNILFLQGTQAALDALYTAGGATEGAFYLTNDTHRLYIGRQNGEKIVPIQVNQGVITVANVAALPTANKDNAGQFYYATEEAVLCTSNGKMWVQINTDTTLKEGSTTISKDDTTKTVKVGSTITDTANKSVNTGFELIEGAGIAFSVDGNKITISASGTGGVSIDLGVAQGADNTEAKISQTSIVTDSAGVAKPAVTNDVYLKAGSGVESVVATTTDNKDVLTINAKKAFTNAKFNNAAQGFTETLTLNDGSETTISGLDPLVKVGKESTKTVHFENGTASLDVYTTEEADAKIKAAVDSLARTADAMVFKGTIGTAGTVTAVPAITECSAGDTYKLLAGFPAITGLSEAKVGDLIVATGTEDENGKLTAAGEFVLIPSGDEMEAAVVAIEHGIKVQNKRGDDTAELGSIALAAGKQITLTDSGEGTDKVVTVAHEAITTATDEVENTAYVARDANKISKKTITVVKGIETTDNGHVSKVITAEEVFNDSQYEVETFTQTVAQEGTAAKVTTTVGLTEQGTPKTANVSVDSKSLTVTASEGQIGVELTWGSF